MLKVYIHIHTLACHTRTFVSNDAKGMTNGLESEDIYNVNYVLFNLTIIYRISYGFNYFLISGCHKHTGPSFNTGTENTIQVSKKMADFDGGESVSAYSIINLHYLLRISVMPILLQTTQNMFNFVQNI